MKSKYKNAFHKTRFTEFIAENVKYPYKSSYEYIAAVFLLSADNVLWKKSQSALTSYSVDFNKINLSGISTEGYALFKTAKSIYLDKSEISFNELCDCELIDESTVKTIFAGVLVFRNGIDILNWRV